jgi:hypothetical protein
MPNAANPHPLRWFDQGKRTNSARFHRVQHAALGDNRGVKPPPFTSTNTVPAQNPPIAAT